MKREDKLIKNTAILSVGTAFSSVFSFVLVPIFSRWLSTSDYGTYDVYLTYVTLLIPVVTLACGEATFRFLLDCKTEEEKSKLLSCTWFISIVGTALGIIVAIIVFMVSGMQQLLPFIALFVSFMLYNQGNYMARGLRKLSAYTIANILYLIFMAIFVTVFVFFNNWGLAGILCGNAIGHFVGFTYLAVSCRMWKYVVFKKPEWSDAKKVISYSAPLMPNSISWWIVNVSDRSIINVVLGASFNGIYAISYKLPSLCTTVFSVFHMSWLESAVDSVNDSDRNEYTNSVLNSIMPFCFSVAAGVLAVNRYFYKWIWDARYIDGIYYVWILLLGVCFSFVAQFLGGLLIAEKKTKENGITTVIAAAANIVVHLSLIWKTGLYAAAISTCVSYALLLIIRVVLLRNTFHFKIHLVSYLAILLFGVITVLQFSHNEVVGVIAFLIAVVGFIFINKKLIINILNKMLRKLRR